MNNPKHVHFVADRAGPGFGHQQVKQSAIAVRLKFVTVRVIEEFHAVFGQRLAGLVEYRGGRTTGLFIERVRVRNPGATGVLQAKCFRVARNTLDFVAVAFKRKMTTDRFKSLGSEQFLEFLRREIVSAGELDVLDAKAADLIKGRRDAVAEL